ncbi:MAG TPA: amidase [Paenibacillus sp.]|nr:amidase [Paenibacillus sp.]
MRMEEAPSGNGLQHFLDLLDDGLAQIEPNLRAFVPEESREDRIRREAERLKREYACDAKPPLFGIPVGVKDLIHVDGLPTQAGSRLPGSELEGNEGSLIVRLKELGAIVAGKTVTEEFAYAGPIPTRNPHDLDRTPGGSSAGSAAAVAAGMCPLSIGTQTMRSVIAPASFCGVVGFKPSFGRIPTDGVLLLAPSFDTIGLFAQDPEGMSYAASLLVPDWKPVDSDDRKPVLGIPNGIYMTLLFDETKRVFREQINRLSEAGYSIKTVDMPWDDDFLYGDVMLRFVQGEMARVHGARFERHRSLYGGAVADAILAGRKVEDAQLDEYRRGQAALRNDLSEVGRKEGVDVWVSPSQAGTAPPWGDRTGWSGMTSIWSYAGCPAVSIPAARLDGMPLGFQCIGAFGGDEALLSAARRIASTLDRGAST